MWKSGKLERNRLRHEFYPDYILHLKRIGRIQVADKLVVATDILSQDRLVDSVQLRTVR